MGNPMPGISIIGAECVIKMDQISGVDTRAADPGQWPYMAVGRGNAGADPSDPASIETAPSNGELTGT